MHLLDSPSTYTQRDPKNIRRSIEMLPKQVVQAWRESCAIKIPASYHTVREIVMSGMGGSGLAGHVIGAALRDRLRVPFTLMHGYDLPAHVGPHTLVILSSYSGDTEEVLAVAAAAKKKRASCLAISCGGTLGRFIKKGTIPGYRFDSDANPSGQPRFGVGYTLVGLIGMLHAATLLPVTGKEIYETVRALEKTTNALATNVPLSKNSAKKLAIALHDRLPVFVGAEHLEGSTRIMSNQLHENAKQFGFHFAIPELNHHLMEGLAHPSVIAKKLAFVFLDSPRVSSRNKKRITLTRAVVARHDIREHVVPMQGTGVLVDVAEALAFGSSLTYYLGILNGVDPAAIPWVTHFKKQLGR